MRFFLLSLGVIAAACGGRITGDDGGLTGSDSGPSPDASASCSDLANVGSDVPMDVMAGDPPPLAASGLQPGQGTYVLVGYTEYEHGGGVSGASGSLLAETVRLVWQNGAYVVDYSETLNDAVVTSSHGTATPAGPGALDVATTCPTTDSFPVDYTTDGTSLTFRYTMPSGIVVETRFTLVTKN